MRINLQIIFFSCTLFPHSLYYPHMLLFPSVWAIAPQILTISHQNTGSIPPVTLSFWQYKMLLIFFIFQSITIYSIKTTYNMKNTMWTIKRSPFSVPLLFFFLHIQWSLEAQSLLPIFLLYYVFSSGPLNLLVIIWGFFSQKSKNTLNPHSCWKQTIFTLHLI